LLIFILVINFYTQDIYAGIKYEKVVYSNIKCYLNGKYIPSYNMNGSVIIDVNSLEEIGYTIVYDMFNNLITAKYQSTDYDNENEDIVNNGNLFTEVGQAQKSKYKLAINGIKIDVYGIDKKYYLNDSYYIKVTNLKKISNISYNAQDKITKVDIYNVDTNLVLDNNVDTNTDFSNETNVYFVDNYIINKNEESLKKVYYTVIFHDYLLDIDLFKKNLVYTIKKKSKQSYDTKYDVKKDTIENKLYYKAENYFKDSKQYKFEKILIEKVELYNSDNSIITILNDNYKSESLFFIY